MLLKMALLVKEEKKDEEEVKDAPPERKSSRIEHRREERGEERADPKVEIKPDLEIPDSLIVPQDEEWSEGCRYFCMLCSSSFTSFGVYKHHIGSFHGMLIEEYRAKFGKHGEVINKISCKMCGGEIVHKNTSIKGHLRSVHNMTLAEYRTRFLVTTETEIEDEMEIDDKEPEEEEDDEDEEEEVEDEEFDHQQQQLTAGEEQHIAVDKQQQLTSGEEPHVVVDEQLPSEELAAGEEEGGELRRWFEGCTYVCIPCNKNYDIYFSYHGHVKKIHNLSMEQYHAKYGQMGETNRYYSCKLCSTNVVWRMFNIRKHLETQHNMSLDEYAGQFEATDQTRRQRSFGKEITGLTKIAEAPRPRERVGAGAKVEEERAWYEGCIFTCQVEGCTMVYHKVESYHSHIQTQHHVSLQDYHRRYGTKGEVLEQYKCRICGARIAHKYSNIASHLTLIHDLSIQEYADTYINIQDESGAERDQEDEPESESEMFIDEEMAEDEEENYEFTEEDVIIEDVSTVQEEQKEAVTEGTEHAWYHGSDLTCKICFKNFANDQWYFHHFSKIHGLTKEQYNEQYGKDGEIYHQYQCLICSSHIRWKYSSIRQHLKQVHGTTIQDYENKYLGGGPSRLHVDPITALKEQARNPCHEVSSPSLPPPPPLKASPAALLAGRVGSSSPAAQAHQLGASSTLSSQSGVSSTVSGQSEANSTLSNPPPMVSKGSLTFENRPESQWYHGSDLTCLVCGKSFVDFTYYCTHIRTVHAISKEQYNEKYGTAAEAFRLYRCLVCGISIKWTYQSICGHIKSHELSIKDYESKYSVLDNQSTESGKISDLTMNIKGGEDQAPSPKKLRLEEVPPGLVTIPNLFGSAQEFEINSILIPNQQPKPKPSRISADISSPTGKWYNQCKFTCKACPEEKYFTVPQALRMHLNGIHSLNRKEYESRYGNAETITKYWTCLICSKELKCQKGIIIQHLLNVHTLELVDYERQYMDAGDQVVARENRKPRKNGRVPLPPPSTSPGATSLKPDSNDSTDLSSFLLQRMQEGPDNVTLDGPVITEAVEEPPEDEVLPFNAPQHSILDTPVHRDIDTSITSMSTLEVEGMDYVPWYFGCRYSCQICNKNWHYPQACRYHLDSVHKLTRAHYETEYGSCEIETRIFHCSLCQRSMKCERDIIKYHLEAKHSMSLENYETEVPNPVVTIGESRRSNAATHSRTSSLTGTQFIPSTEMAPTVAAPPPPAAPQHETETKVPWYRGSHFTCIPCNRQFTAQVSYISHINSKHGMNLREYREQFGSQEEIKQYTCRVPGCTRYVAWTYSGINDHLKSHSLTMAEYEAKYLGREKSSLKNSQKVDNLGKYAMDWSIGECRECMICQVLVVGDLAAFTSHLQSVHSLSREEYTGQHGPCDKQQRHSCAECEQSIDLLPGSMAEHLLVHGLDIVQYYRKYIAKTTDQRKAGLNGSPLQAGVILQSPESKLSPDKDPNKPLVFKVRKNHWANGCKYKCSLCPDIQFPEEFVFKKHVQLAHQMTTEEYHNNFGSPAVALQAHTCKVCNKSVKHEYTAILNHLRVKHAMTLTMYTQTYIKPNNTTVGISGSCTQLTEPSVNAHKLSGQSADAHQLKGSSADAGQLCHESTDEQHQLKDEVDEEDGEFYTVYT